jgi:drug/metabolite transporter (DMT)-like permease
MDTQKHMSRRAWAELLLLGLIWGGSFLSIRIALNEVPVVTVVLHRTFWAMLLLWAVVAWMGLRVPRDARTWLGFLGMGLLNNIVPFGLMTWGQQYIETGLTSILNATTAVMGALVAAVVFADERLSARRILGVGLGFAGVALATGIEALSSFDLRSAAQWAIIGGAFSYALAGAWARVRLSHLPPQLAAAGMLTGSTLLLIPAALVIDGVPRFDLAPATLVAIAYYALCATAGAYLLYYRILAMAGSANLLLVTLIIPPVAILLGALVLGETLHPRAFAGFAVIGLGLLVLNGTLRLPWPRHRATRD